MRINLITEEVIFMIRRKDMRDPRFFLYDYLTPPQEDDIVLWTPNQFKAREFYSEESVENFLCDKLTSRPCEIIYFRPHETAAVMKCL